MQNVGDVELQEQIQVAAVRMHAATAAVVALSAALDTDGTWAASGMRSCAYWLTIHAGVDVYTGAEMVRVGHALESLPALRAAFAAGRISFDKVRAVTRVATPADEDIWLQVAMQASGGQFARICRGVRLTLAADDPRRTGDALLNRGVRTWWRDDGMLELIAILPPQDGAIVMAALEAVTHVVATEQSHVPSPDQPELDTDHRTQPMLRADAFVRLCESWVAASAATPTLAPTTQVVVHVDADVLSGSKPDGRSRIDDGPWLSPSSVRRLSCDADVVTVIERDGLPIDVGRLRRVIPPKLRLALQSRDGGCRFPGCSVPAMRTQGHHLEHWADGGKTNLLNLVSLCGFHHGRHHEGRFQIRAGPSGDFTFTAADGKPIVPIRAPETARGGV